MTTDSREDLRQRLNELEATVRGLTQELVEANDRIRLLESRLEGTEGDAANKPMPTGENRTARDESPAEPDDGTVTGEGDEEDDIIVA